MPQQKPRLVRAFIDLPGLSPSANTAERQAIADALNLEGTRLETEDERLDVLARLMEGAGVTVFTGPLGAPFWSVVSLEVRVRVVPDDYEYKPRASSLASWGCTASGLSETKAKALVAKPPTPRHSLYQKWEEASALVTRLQERVHAGAPPIVIESYTSDIILDPAEQLNFLDNIPAGEFVALDYEWDRQTLLPEGVSLSTKDRNFWLPVVGRDIVQPEGHEDALRRAVSFLTARTETVWHNAKADLRTQFIGDPVALSRKPVNDTLVMAWLVGESDLSLKALARTRLNRDPTEYPGELRDLPVELAARYAAAGDTRNTYDLYMDLLVDMEAKQQMSVYHDIERPVTPIVASMERGGTPVDPVELQRLRDSIFAEEEAIRESVLERTGRDFASDKEQSEYITDMLGYDLGTLNAWTLARVPDAWMDEVLNYRRLRHQRRAFLDKHLARWEEAGRPDILWAYTSFNQAGEAISGDVRGFKKAPRTGRFSSSSIDEPGRLGFGNLQNQPSSIRSAFIAPKGTKFWSLDYTGLELHIAAAVSGDKRMIEILSAQCPDVQDNELCPHYPKHGDMHGALQYDVEQKTGKKVERRTAKSTNFEKLYGGGDDKLVGILAKDRAFITIEEARLMGQTHKDTFAGYHGHAEKVREFARKHGGYAETIFGRRRYEGDIYSHDDERRGWAERSLVNMTIQGCAADVVKMAMSRAVPVLDYYGAHMSLQVHDELCGWVPEEKAEAFVSAMKDVMRSIPLPGLRLKVAGGYGNNWSEVH